MNCLQWITELFPVPGFFVEAGAHDGIGDSQTKALEDLGWAGICVEPSAAFAGLRKSRSCRIDNRCLWSRDDCAVQFLEVAGNARELSGIPECFGDHWDRENRPHTLTMKPAVTLPTLLRQHGAPPRIEYLSLDTEGAELEILKAHDFCAFLFLTATIEHNGVLAKRDSVRALMRGHGYAVLDPRDTQDQTNDWFLHQSVKA